MLCAKGVERHLIRDDFVNDTAYLMRRCTVLLSTLPPAVLSQSSHYHTATSVTAVPQSTSARFTPKKMATFVGTKRHQSDSNLAVLSRALHDAVALTADLFDAVKLDDGVVDLFAGVCLGCVFGDNSDAALQSVALAPLQRLFERSEACRESILSDILNEIGKLSGQRTSLLLGYSPESDAAQLQVCACHLGW